MTSIFLQVPSVYLNNSNRQQKLYETFSMYFINFKNNFRVAFSITLPSDAIRNSLNDCLHEIGESDALG